MFPASGKWVPAITLRSVDFPAPLLPITVANSPSAIVRVTPRKATFSLDAPGLKVFWTCCSRSIGRGHPPGPRAQGGSLLAQRRDLIFDGGHRESEDDEHGRDDLEVGGRKAAPERYQDR